MLCPGPYPGQCYDAGKLLNSRSCCSLAQVFAGAAGFQPDCAEPCRSGRTRAAGALAIQTSAIMISTMADTALQDESMQFEFASSVETPTSWNQPPCLQPPTA